MKNETMRETDSGQELLKLDYIRNKVEEMTAQEITANGYNIDKISNAVFMSVCDHVGRALFGGLSVTESPSLLACLAVIYPSLCNKYDKIPSFEGFAYLCQISPDFVRSWAQDVKSLSNNSPLLEQIMQYLDCYNIIYHSDKESIGMNNIHNKCILFNNTGEMLTALRGRIFQRLHYCREEAIKNKLLTGSQQIGAIAVANKDFNWDADKVAREERARALTLQDLPKIDSYVNSPKALETATSLESL